MLTNSTFCIVIPTYNEVDNLKRLCRLLNELYPNAVLIISDDDSGDGTEALLNTLKAEGINIDYIKHPHKDGIGPALKAGILKALEYNTEFIVQMDADFSHSPFEIQNFISNKESGDVIVGSKYMTGSVLHNWPFYRYFISRMGNLYIQFFLRLPVSDATSGFKLYKTAALKKIDLKNIKSKGFIFQTEIIYKLMKSGAALTEIPISFSEREFGRSKMKSWIFLEALWRVLIHFHNSGN